MAFHFDETESPTAAGEHFRHQFDRVYPAITREHLSNARFGCIPGQAAEEEFFQGRLVAGTDLGRLRAFGAILHFEANGLPLVEGAESAVVDG